MVLEERQRCRPVVRGHLAAKGPQGTPWNEEVTSHTVSSIDRDDGRREGYAVTLAVGCRVEGSREAHEGCSCSRVRTKLPG